MRLCGAFEHGDHRWQGKSFKQSRTSRVVPRGYAFGIASQSRTRIGCLGGVFGPQPTRINLAHSNRTC